VRQDAQHTEAYPEYCAALGSLCCGWALCLQVSARSSSESPSSRGLALIEKPAQAHSGRSLEQISDLSHEKQESSQNTQVMLSHGMRQLLTLYMVWRRLGVPPRTLLTGLLLSFLTPTHRFMWDSVSSTYLRKVLSPSCSAQQTLCRGGTDLLFLPTNK